MLQITASVVDPWHFGTDPDPRIRASGQWIRIRLRILLFSSLTFKALTENLFLFKISAYYFLKVHLQYILFLGLKLIKKAQNKTVGIKVFLTIFAWW